MLMDNVTENGFYLETTDILRIKQMTQKFSVFLVQEHVKSYLAFCQKLAAFKGLSVNSQELMSLATTVWPCRFNPSVFRTYTGLDDLYSIFDVGDLDTTFTLTFYPDPSGGKRLFGSALVGKQPWFDAWLAVPGVTEYKLVTNPNARFPGDLEEYEKRVADWHRVVPTFAYPDRLAFCVDLVSPRSPLGFFMHGSDLQKPTT
jgi:hypothetical protein